MPVDYDPFKSSGESDGRGLSEVCRKLSDEEKEAAHVLGDKIALQVMVRNEEAATALIRRAFEKLRDQELGSSLIDATLADLPGLGVRVANLMELGVGITTLGGALECEINELLAIPNFSYHSLVSLYQGIAKFCVIRCLKLEKELQRGKG